MKPNFALNLTDDSIGLLHRTTRGWLEVGRANLDDPDLSDALGYLRGSALGLEPRGINTKLIIPNSQILYMTLKAPGPRPVDRRAQIREELEGRTPYAVKDLAFDWAGTGPEVQVAVVARETLDEAEAFAVAHRFNPVSFVAIPGRGAFAKEPWFGPSKYAASVLGEDENVERDQDPVQIVAREASAQAPEAEAKPQVAVAGPEEQPKPRLDAAGTATPAAPSSAAPSAAAAAPKLAPAARPVSAPPKPPAADTGGAEKANEPGDLAQTPPAFTSRRTKTDSAPALGGADRKAPPSASAPAAAEVAAPSPTAAAASLTATAPFPPPKAPLTGDAMVTAQKVPIPHQRLEAPLPGRDDKAKPKKAARKSQYGAGPVAAKIASLLARKPETATAPAPKSSQPQPAARPGATPRTDPRNAARTNARSEAEAMTIFGARKGRVGGKPRYLGLILTVLLLLFLAAVALWSTLYLARGSSDPEVQTAAAPALASQPDAVEAAVAAPDMIPPLAEDDTPRIEDEMLADLQDPATEADAGFVAETSPDAAPPDAAPPDATVAAPDTALDDGEPALDAGIAAAAAPEVNHNPIAEPLDEIYLASIDAGVVLQDPVSLVPVAEINRDMAPSGQLPPPPFGTFYQFDANGLIVPTAEGIITPEGVRLVAGRPETVPPTRPAREAPANAEAALQSAGAVTNGVADTPSTYNAIPALSGARPKPRPPAAPDDAALEQEAPTQFTSLRPRQRPASALTKAEDARIAAGAASLAAGAPIANGGSLSPLAVAVSRKPEARPQDFSKAIEAALAVAVRTPDAASGSMESSSADPEEHDEPETAMAAPSIPTRASVAKQATFTNVINLSKTNLIGIYGTKSNRSALVRQANGKYVKVKVGDKVDGGKVAAIGERDLRYVKGGKTLILELPKT